MDTVYQFTALLSLSLITVTIAIFVMGVSLLGRAIKRATNQKRSAEEAKNEEVQRKLGVLREKFAICKDGSKRETSEIKKEINDLENKQVSYEKQIKKIEGNPSVLTVSGGVLRPCVLLLLAAISSLIALQMAEDETASLIIWLVGIGCICGSIAFIIRSLKVIQDVALVSEEAAFRTNIEAFTKALQTHDASRKPSIVMRHGIPERICVDTEFELSFDLYLTRGDLGKDTDVYFFSAPNEFTFLNADTWVQNHDSGIPGYLSTMFNIGDVRKGIRSTKNVLKVKAPNKSGNFELTYKILCSNGYDSGDKKISLKIIKPRRRRTSQSN